ncbi:hypothetical protein GW891_02420 [bacterium]|nr:hypothetical protein [bacterium]
MKAINNQYIATTSTNATNNTINAKVFHFSSGFTFIQLIAHFISKPSQIQAHNQANQIANQAQTEANQLNHVAQSILNETTNA